jgi:hypothetical protein
VVRRRGGRAPSRSWMVGGWRAGPEGGRLLETGGEEAGGSEDNLSQRRCRRTCDRRRRGLSARPITV